jgi:hypothetical protein
MTEFNESMLINTLVSTIQDDEYRKTVEAVIDLPETQKRILLCRIFTAVFDDSSFQAHLKSIALKFLNSNDFSNTTRSIEKRPTSSSDSLLQGLKMPPSSIFPSLKFAPISSSKKRRSMKSSSDDEVTAFDIRDHIGENPQVEETSQLEESPQNEETSQLEESPQNEETSQLEESPQIEVLDIRDYVDDSSQEDGAADTRNAPTLRYMEESTKSDDDFIDDTPLDVSYVDSSSEDDHEELELLSDVESEDGEDGEDGEESDHSGKIYCDVCDKWIVLDSFSAREKKNYRANQLQPDPKKRFSIMCLRHSTTSSFNDKYGFIRGDYDQAEPSVDNYNGRAVDDHLWRQRLEQYRYGPNPYKDEIKVESESEEESDGIEEESDGIEEEEVYEFDTTGSLLVYGVPLKKYYRNHSNPDRAASMYMQEYRRTRTSSHEALLGRVEPKKVEKYKSKSTDELRHYLIDSQINSMN